MQKYISDSPVYSDQECLLYDAWDAMYQLMVKQTGCNYRTHHVKSTSEKPATI